MAWTSGTASNMVDLLQDLQSFLSVNGWTVLRSETFQNSGGVIGQSGDANSAGDPGVNEYRIVMQGPGYTGAQPPVFGIETRRNAGAGLYYLVSAAAVGGGSAGVPVYQLPGVGNERESIAVFMIWDSSINYWFTEDNGAVCVVVQISNLFFHFYIGHYVPLATPGEIPQPGIYTGNCRTYQLNPYNSGSAIHCFGSARGTNNEDTGFIWGGSNSPLSPRDYGNANSTIFYFESDRDYLELGLTASGEYIIYPITMISQVAGCYGQLSLLFKAPFTQVSPGSTINVDGVTYLITNNGITDDIYNRFAVRLG